MKNTGLMMVFLLILFTFSSCSREETGPTKKEIADSYEEIFAKQQVLWLDTLFDGFMTLFAVPLIEIDGDTGNFEAPALYLADFMTPGGDGLRAVEAQRADEGSWETLISAWYEKGTRHMSYGPSAQRIPDNTRDSLKAYNREFTLSGGDGATQAKVILYYEDRGLKTSLADVRVKMGE